MSILFEPFWKQHLDYLSRIKNYIKNKNIKGEIKRTKK